MKFFKKRRSETQDEQKLLNMGLDSLIVALVKISLPNYLQKAINWDYYENFGCELSEDLSGSQLELLHLHGFLSDQTFEELKEMRSNFQNVYMDIPEADDEFWDIQRKKAQKIIEKLWKEKQSVLTSRKTPSNEL